MKRYVKAAYSYSNSFTAQYGNRNFMVKYNISNDIIRSGQVTEIHPYDDADYAWAKIEGLQVKFIMDGKVIDRMTMYDYDEENFEDFDDYLDAYFNDIAQELRNINKDVEPRMIHY